MPEWFVWVLAGAAALVCLALLLDWLGTRTTRPTEEDLREVEEEPFGGIRHYTRPGAPDLRITGTLVTVDAMDLAELDVVYGEYGSALPEPVERALREQQEQEVERLHDAVAASGRVA